LRLVAQKATGRRLVGFEIRATPRREKTVHRDASVGFATAHRR
jgi:hypothetical protein